MTLRAHADAVMSMLSPLASLPSATPIFRGSTDGRETAGTPVAGLASSVTGMGQPVTPYIVVGFGFPSSSDRLGVYHGTLTVGVRVTCVGAVEDEALWAVEKTRALLLDVAPVVAGRSTSPLRLQSTSEVLLDRDLLPPVPYVVDLYQFVSTG